MHGRVPAWPMWVIALVFMIDNVDQNIVRGMVPQLQAHFHVGFFAIGVLMSAFVVVNGLVTLPAGYLADRWHRARSLGTTVALWSIVSALGGAMPTFGALVASRGLLGFGQAVTDPSSSSLLGDYYELERRGRAFAVQQCLTFVGIGLGLALGGSIAPRYGWRAGFVVSSVPGLVIAAMAFRLVEPRRGAADRASAGVVDGIEMAAPGHERVFRGSAKAFAWDMWRGLRADLATILAIPTLRYALVGVSALLFTVTAVGSWMPEFYERQLHLGQGDATAAFGALVVLGGVPGVLFGGRLADRWARRVRGARVAIPGYCLLTTCTLFMVSYLPMPFWAVFPIQLVAFFTATLAIPALRAGLTDAVPANLRGAGFGAFNLASVLFGTAAAPVATSFVAEKMGGNFRSAFLIVTPVAYVGAFLLLAARDHLERDTAAIFTKVMEALAADQALAADAPPVQPAPDVDTDRHGS